MMPRRLFAVGLALSSVVGCSSKSDGPEPPKAATESARPDEAAPEQAATVATSDDSSASPPSEPAASDPSQEPPSPYEGLDAEQAAFYERVEDLLEPVATTGANAYGNLKEAERRAKAVMQLGGYKVSLNREAETRLRATLARVTEAQAMASQYARASKEVWPTQYDMSVAMETRRAFPVRDALIGMYERVLDEGVDVPPDARQALGEMARFEGLSDPELSINIEALTEELRTRLLEQSVTGDHLFLMAYAVRERGEDVLRRRNFSRTFHGLVNALPPEHRTELLMRLAWDERREAGIDEQREALVAGPDYQQPRERTADEIRNAYLAIEQGRRDAIEGYFRRIDEPGWQALVALDGLLAEFQAILDAILPDLEYRFRPLLPLNAPRGIEENVLSKIPLPGSVEDRIPTIEVRGFNVVLDAPAGWPRFNEVVKPGQVLVGTIRLSNNISQTMVIRGVELQIHDIKGESVTGELRIPEGRELGGPSALSFVPLGDEGAKTLPLSGSIDNTNLSFSVDWNPFGGAPTYPSFTATVDKGPLAGKITNINGEGRFSFEPKK